MVWPLVALALASAPAPIWSTADERQADTLDAELGLNRAVSALLEREDAEVDDLVDELPALCQSTLVGGETLLSLARALDERELARALEGRHCAPGRRLPDDVDLALDRDADTGAWSTTRVPASKRAAQPAAQLILARTHRPTPSDLKDAQGQLADVTRLLEMGVVGALEVRLAARPAEASRPAPDCPGRPLVDQVALRAYPRAATSARLLVSAGAPEGLGVAALLGDLARVDALLAQGADPNANEGEALRLAVLGHHPLVVQRLLAKGASADPVLEGPPPCAGDRPGQGLRRSPLRLAIATGQVRVAALLARSAGLHDADQEALADAWRSGRLAMLALLLERGADPNLFLNVPTSARPTIAEDVAASARRQHVPEAYDLLALKLLVAHGAWLRASWRGESAAKLQEQKGRAALGAFLRAQPLPPAPRPAPITAERMREFEAQVAALGAPAILARRTRINEGQVWAPWPPRTKLPALPGSRSAWLMVPLGSREAPTDPNLATQVVLVALPEGPEHPAYYGPFPVH